MFKYQQGDRVLLLGKPGVVVEAQKLVLPASLRKQGTTQINEYRVKLDDGTVATSVWEKYLAPVKRQVAR